MQADGIAPLSYQWQLNGTNLTASTNAVLNLTNITASQAGEYTVVVSNSFGTVTSSAAVLTVYSQVRQSWVARYDSLRNAGPLFATSVSVDSRGSVVIAGEDNWNYATVKYDATGNQLWTARYYGSDRSDGPNALRLDGADNIVVTGQSHSVTGGATSYFGSE